MAKKKISGKDDILNQPVRYGSPRPNFPREPGSISIRYGLPDKIQKNQFVKNQRNLANQKQLNDMDVHVLKFLRNHLN